jgi:hypothetical protein
MQSGGDDGLILGSAAPAGAIISTSEVNAAWQGITVESYTTLAGVNTLTFLRARGGAKATPAAAQSGDSVFSILAGAYDGSSWCVPFQWEFVLNAAPAYPQARGVLTLYTSDGETRMAFSDVAGTRTTKLPDLGGGTDLPVCSDAQGVLSKRDLVNADIDAAAAIAGTKVAPNFGSQNLATTGDLSVNDITTVRHITASGTVQAENLLINGVIDADDSANTLGLFGVTPVTQRTVTAITNSTGGTANGDLAAVSGSGADTNINNNFTEVYTMLTALRTALVDLGAVAT